MTIDDFLWVQENTGFVDCFKTKAARGKFTFLMREFWHNGNDDCLIDCGVAVETNYGTALLRDPSVVFYELAKRDDRYADSRESTI